MNEPAYEYYRVEIDRGAEPAKAMPASLLRGIRFSKIPTANSEVRIFDRSGNAVLFNSFAKAHLATDFHAQVVDDLLKMSVLAFRAKYSLDPDAPLLMPRPDQTPGGFSRPEGPLASSAASSIDTARSADADPTTISAPGEDPPPNDPASQHYRVEHLHAGSLDNDTSSGRNILRVVSRSGEVVLERAVSDDTEAARVQHAIVTDLLMLHVAGFLKKYRP